MHTAPVARAATRSHPQTLMRYGYLPLMLLGMNGCAIWLANMPGRSGWLLLLTVLAVGASFLVERAIPFLEEWNCARGDTAPDLAHAIINEASTLAAVACLPWVTAGLPVLYRWPDDLPFVAQVVLGLLVLDFGITLAHYVSHRFDLLWRFHAVHHSVTRLYGFNGLMKHPLHQAVELGAGVAPLVLFGLPQEVAVALAFCTLVQLLLQHSNADYAAGPLGRWLALNRVHRLHHRRSAALGNVNFGLFTLLWDRMLGTYESDQARMFSPADLGIEAEPEYPKTYLAQLARPFKA